MQARNTHSEKRRTDPKSVTVDELTNVKEDHFHVTEEPSDDGSSTVTLHLLPTTVSRLELTIRLNDKLIHGSPFAIAVKPGAASVSNCYLSMPDKLLANNRQDYWISVKDAHGNIVEADPQLAFEESLRSEEGEDVGLVMIGNVFDAKQGGYACSLLASRSGKATLAITCKAQHIQSSPMCVTINSKKRPREDEEETMVE